MSVPKYHRTVLSPSSGWLILVLMAVDVIKDKALSIGRNYFNL